MSGFHVERSEGGRRLSAPDAVVTVLASGDHTGGAYELMLVQAPWGPPPPLHAEPWAKTFHLLRGRLLIRTDSRDCELAPGDSITVVAGTVNTFAVLTDSAVFLLVTAGTAMSAFFADLDGALREQPSPEDPTGPLLEVAGRHGIRFADGMVSP